MKRIMYAMLLCMPFVTFAQTSVNKGIQWTNGLSWEEVRQKAKKENKYIFVDAYATWCGPCKMMDKDVYPNERVGSELGREFIAIKVQMDSTKNDDLQVKQWYEVAHSLQKDHSISGYPSFLFFNPDGKIIHTDIGYKSVGDFIRMVKVAKDPLRNMYYSQLEDYKKGLYDYKIMPGLALFVGKLLNDKALANTIAKQCKENYLDALTEAQLMNREYLDFYGYFFQLVNSKDNVFQLCYHKPEKLDSIKQWNGWSKMILTYTIVKEEIENKILKDGKATIKNPDWRKLQAIISNKYKKLDANRLLLEYKLSYYQNLSLDWELWAKTKDEMIHSYPPKPPYGLEVYTQINGWGGAWLVFMKCNKKEVLKKALVWVDLALKLDGEEFKDAYLDTKANLLYKLGKKEDAIRLQKEAVFLAPKRKDLSNALDKMLNNEPTYVDQGAIWSENTLPKKCN